MAICVYDFLCIYNRMVPNWVPQKIAYPRNESRLDLHSNIIYYVTAIQKGYNYEETNSKHQRRIAQRIKTACSQHR